MERKKDTNQCSRTRCISCLPIHGLHIKTTSFRVAEKCGLRSLKDSNGSVGAQPRPKIHRDVITGFIRWNDFYFPKGEYDAPLNRNSGSGVRTVSNSDPSQTKSSDFKEDQLQLQALLGDRSDASWHKGAWLHSSSSKLFRHYLQLDGQQYVRS